MNQGKKTKLTLYVLSFLIPALLFLLVCILQGMYPFGEKTILTGDVNYQFIDYLAYFKTIIFENNDLSYTFSKTIGGDMIGFSAYYLFSPFNLLLLLCPNRWLPLGLMLMIVVKSGLCGFCFFLMVSKLYGVRKEGLLFSTTYALMGYIIVYFQLYAYFDNLMLLPILVLGIHRLIENPKRKLLYLVCLCTSIVINFYIGWMLCIFSVIYFIYQLIIKTESIRNWKANKDQISSFLFSSIMAGGLSACVLIPSLLSLRGEKNSFHLGFYRSFSFIDLFSRLYTDSFKGNISSCLPNIYCGVLLVVLLILFLFNRGIAKKERIVSGLLLLFFALNFYVNTLNVAWHGFNLPIGFPYRYSFLLSFLIILFGYRGFLCIEEYRKSGLLLYVVLFLSYSALIVVRGSEVIGKKEILLDLIISISILAVLLIFWKKKTSMILFLFLFAIQIGDLTWNAFDALNYFSFNGMTEYQTYIDEVGDTIGMVKKQDDGFYRLEKYFRRSHNDSMQFNYSGLTHYSSCEKKEVIDFMGKMGFRDNGNWSFYNSGSTSFIDSFFGVKYLLSQFDSTGKPYEVRNQIHDYTIFRNPYALPLVFTSGSKIKDITYEQENPFEIQNQMANAVNGKENKILIPEKNNNTEIVNLTQREENGITIYEKIDVNQDAYIEYSVPITRQDHIYAYFTAPDIQQAELYLDGEFLTNYFDKYKWDILELPYDKPKDEIKVRIVAKQEVIRIENAYFYYEDEEALKCWYEDVNRYPSELSKVTSSHLTGKITTDESKGMSTMVFSIPYEKGWKIYVDGQSVKTEKAIDMLLCAQIPSGNHLIELKYIPSGRLFGAIISIIFLIILNFHLFYKKVKKMN